MNKKPTLKTEVDIGSFTCSLAVAGTPRDVTAAALIVLRNVYDSIADKWSEAAAEVARNRIMDVVNDDEFWTMNAGEREYDGNLKQ